MMERKSKYDEMTPEIEADFDTDSFFERHNEAMRLVDNRYAKADLVDLVAHLLKFKKIVRGE